MHMIKYNTFMMKLKACEGVSLVYYIVSNKVMCTKKIQSHLKMENIFLQHQGKQLLQLVLLHLSKILFCRFLYLTQSFIFLSYP